MQPESLNWASEPYRWTVVTVQTRSCRSFPRLIGGRVARSVATRSELQEQYPPNYDRKCTWLEGLMPHPTRPGSPSPARTAQWGRRSRPQAIALSRLGQGGSHRSADQTGPDSSGRAISSAPEWDSTETRRVTRTSEDVRVKAESTALRGYAPENPATPSVRA